MSDKVRVIFRKFENGDVIGLMPDLPGDMDPRTCLSYMHVGQHGAASRSLIKRLEPASAAEYRDLLDELAGMYGYGAVEVVK